MSYNAPSSTSSDSLSPPPSNAATSKRFAAFDRSAASSSLHPPSTPERRSLDPIPSTTPLGPPPSATKSLFTTSSRRPGGYRRNDDTPPSQAPKFFTTHAGNAPREALFGKPAVGANGLDSSVISDAKGRKSTLRSSPPHMPPPSTAQGGLYSKKPANGGANPMFAARRDRVLADDESLANISPGSGYGVLGRSTQVGQLPDLMGEDRFGQDMRQSSPQMSGKKRARVDFNGVASNTLEYGIAARGYAACHPPETLTDSDEMILGTEDILTGLRDRGSRYAHNDDTKVGSVAGEALMLWIHILEHSRNDKEASLSVALTSLFLPLNQAGGHWNGLRARDSKASRNKPVSIPEALVAWLSRFNQGGIDILDEVNPLAGVGYATADTFWDAVTWAALTGRLHLVVKLLAGAKFTEQQDSEYTDIQLDYIDQGVECVIEMVQQSPGLRDGDWDIRGSAWGIHRLQIEKTKAELLQLRLGYGQEEEEDLSEDLDDSTHRGKNSLPRSIYEALVDVCQVLLGDKGPILAAANDWIEAVLSLTIWWDGEETSSTDDFDYFLSASLSASTRNNKRGKPPRHQTRAVDVTPTLAYRQRIQQVFHMVLEEEEFTARGHGTAVDLADPLQIGVGCILEGEMEGFFRVLSTSSMTVASATIQIASAGGWLTDSLTKPKALLDLTQNDLLVLSYANDGLSRANEQKTSAFRDELVAQYAMLVSTKKNLNVNEAFAIDGREGFTGWEIGLAILGELDDNNLAAQKAKIVLDAVPLGSSEDVNHVIAIAESLGFASQVIGLAEKHADQLVYSRTNYGDAILCYARSRRVQKLKDLAQSLITFSIIQSSPYPSESEMDESLKELIKSPQIAVDYAAASGDVETAYHFVHTFGGYCALRKFYELRDGGKAHEVDEMEIDGVPHGNTSKLKDAQKAKEMGSALVELVRSAAEDVKDGEADEDAVGLVPVEALSGLLGEVYGFIKHNDSALSVPHLTTILSSLETITTLSPTLSPKLDVLLTACLQQAREPTPSSPPDLLKRGSTGLSGMITRTGTMGSGSGSGSEAFSFIGSSMFNSQVLAPRPNGTGSSASSSGVLVKSVIKRGWDWRELVVNRDAQGVREEIVNGLRKGVGRSVAEEWVIG